MAKTRDYMDYLDESIDIAPANSQEEYQAAETIADVLRDHGLETNIEEFNSHPWSTIVSSIAAVLLAVLLVVGGLTEGAIHIICLLLSAVLAGLTLFMHFTGTNLLESVGPASRSQNVVAVHRAEGNMVVKGSRPIVIVAHYDTPRQSLLYSGPLARLQGTLRSLTIPCYMAVAVSVLFQIMGFLPSIVRTVMWVVGIIAALPLLLLAIVDIHAHFATCTPGSNDNKSSVAALLSLANKVRPAEDRVSGGEQEGADDRAVRRRARRAGDAKPTPAAPRQIEVVEEVRGVRHGADVLSSLGILPPECEIVYQEPRVQVVEEPVATPFDKALDSDEYADVHATTEDRDENVPEFKDDDVPNEGAASIDESADKVPEGDVAVEDGFDSDSLEQREANRRTVAPILPPLEEEQQSDDTEGARDEDDSEKSETDEGRSRDDEYEDDYDDEYEDEYEDEYDDDYDEESYDEDDEDWEKGSAVGSWFSGIFSNIKDRFAKSRSAKEDDEDEEDEDYEEEYDDDYDDEWMDYDDEEEDDGDESAEDDVDDEYEEEYDEEYEEEYEDEYEEEPEERDEEDAPKEDGTSEVEPEPSVEVADEEQASGEDESPAEPAQSAEPELEPKSEAESAPAPEIEPSTESQERNIALLLPHVDEDDASDAALAPANEQVEQEADESTSSDHEDAESSEEEERAESRAFAGESQGDDENLEDEREDEGNYDETYDDEEQDYQDEEYVDEEYEGEYYDEQEYEEEYDEEEYDDDYQDDAEYDDDYQDDAEYDDDYQDDAEYDEYGEEDDGEYEDEYEGEDEEGYYEEESRPSLKERISGFFNKIRMGEPKETDVEYNEYGAPVEDDYDQEYADEYAGEYEDEDRGVFEEAYNEDDFYEDDYEDEPYDESMEYGYDYEDEGGYEPAGQNNPYAQDENYVRPYAETEYGSQGEADDYDDEYDEQYDGQYDERQESGFVDVRLDFDDVEEDYDPKPQEGEPQQIEPQQQPLSDPNLLHFDREEDDDIPPRDTTGLDMISDSYDLYPQQSMQPQERRRPEPLGDPTWGVTSYQPARPTMNIARRAALFDLPDPSASTIDPLADEYDDYEDEYVEDARFDEAPKREADAASSTRDASGPADIGATGPMGVEAGADSQGESSQPNRQDSESSQNGFWGDSSRRSDWKGGATMREDARNEGDEPLVLEADDLQDAILELGDDYLISHDIWFVATGASEVNHAGIRAFIDAHRRDIRGAFLVNLNSIGAGSLSVIVREGLHAPRRADRRLVRMITGIAQDLHIPIDTAMYNWDECESATSMRSRVRSVTIAGLDENNLPAYSHTSSDIPENVDPRQVSDVVRIVTELIRRS